MPTQYVCIVTAYEADTPLEAEVAVELSYAHYETTHVCYAASKLEDLPKPASVPGILDSFVEIPV